MLMLEGTRGLGCDAYEGTRFPACSGMASVTVSKLSVSADLDGVDPLVVCIRIYALPVSAAPVKQMLRALAEACTSRVLQLHL